MYLQQEKLYLLKISHFYHLLRLQVPTEGWTVGPAVLLSKSSLNANSSLELHYFNYALSYIVPQSALNTVQQKPFGF